MKRETIFRVVTPALAAAVAIMVAWPVAAYILWRREQARCRRNDRLLREAAAQLTDGWLPPARGLLGLVVPSDDPRQQYRLRPLVKGYAGYAPVRVNAAGQRDRTYPTQKPPRTCRTVVLGDSHAFGYGVGRASDTFPKILEALLSRAHLSQTHEVLNFAVTSYGTQAEAATLKLEALNYDPDIVVLQFCWNDIDPPPIRREPRPPVSGSRISDAIRQLWTVGWTPRNAGPHRPNANRHKSYRHDVGWPACTKAIAEIRRLAGHRPTFFLVDYGHFTIDSGKPESISDQAIRIAQAAGFTIVDPWPDFLAYLRERRLTNSAALDVSRWDSHPNRRRHEVLAHARRRAFRAILPATDAERVSRAYFAQ